MIHTLSDLQILLSVDRNYYIIGFTLEVYD